MIQALLRPLLTLLAYVRTADLARGLIALAFGLSCAATSHAQSAPAAAPKAGVDYALVQNPQSTEDPNRIEVLEFFWYGCPHCFRFEGELERWIKAQPKDVLVRRVPIRFREDQEPHQRLYYTLEALNRLDDLHAKAFQAIHVDKLTLSDANAIADWAQKQGLNRDKFLEVYNAFSVRSKAQRALRLMEAYRIDGVPTLVINGKYTTSPAMVSSYTAVLSVADALIAQERAARLKQSPTASAAAGKASVASASPAAGSNKSSKTPSVKTPASVAPAAKPRSAAAPAS